MSEKSTRSDDKLEKVFDAASNVFSQYRFRRTSMNDVAQAAGFSRPALYLMFEKKEDLFRQLATSRQNQAIDLAVAELAQDKPRAFVELLMSSIGGQKKSATSIRDFRRKVNNAASIFMASIIPGGEK
jgi:AcrR family transcriptional regulator